MGMFVGNNGGDDDFTVHSLDEDRLTPREVQIISDYADYHQISFVEAERLYKEGKI